MVLKKCFKCGIEKELSAFYKHAKMKDGYLNKCKECNKIDTHNHRVLNIEKIREYDRGRGSLPSRIMANNERMKKYRIENPEKFNAVNAAGNALRDGRIKRKPCEICGAIERVEMHHNDYSKPLCVVFLCSVHHKRAHGMGLDY